MKKGQTISYKEAMEILQQMFTGLDEDTIKSVLYMNRGKLEQTIESLLILCDENPNAQVNEQIGGNNYYEDQNFSGGQQQQGLDGFIDPQVIQERQDLKLAQQLQYQFDKEANQQMSSQYKMQSQYQYQPSRPNQSKIDKKQKEREKKERERIEKERKEKEKQDKQNKQYKVAQSAVNYENHQFAGDDNDFKINKNQSQMKPKKTFSQKVQGLKQNFMSLFKKKKKQNQQQQSNHQNEQLAIDDDAGIELLDLNEQQLNFSDEEQPQQKQQQYQSYGTEEKKWQQPLPQQQYQSYGNEEKKLQQPIPQKEESKADLEKFDVDEEEEQGALKHQIYSTNYKQSNKQQTLLNKQDNSNDDLNLQL